MSLICFGVAIAFLLAGPVGLAVLVLFFFSLVPLLYWPKEAADARVDFGLFATGLCGTIH
jgi:hypothetical protein